MKKINVGIMGIGRIAGVVAQTLKQLDCLNCYAAGSRSLEKAQAFVKEYGFEVPYGSYSDLVNDPAVDLVYIATPHSEHIKNIKLCAEHGKNIICEKAFTLTADETQEAIDICKKHNVFLCEAIWPRYSPMAEKIVQIIKSGVIGDILSVDANLGYCNWRARTERIYRKDLGGGALLDVGIYCLNFIDLVLGSDFKEVSASALLDPEEHTDQCDSVILTYPDGVSAHLYCSLVGGTDRRAVVYGTKGYMLVANVNNYDGIEVYDNTRELVEKVDCVPYISGYEFEFEEACRCINQGLIESPVVPLSQSLRLMQVMDAIREKTGVVF